MDSQQLKLSIPPVNLIFKLFQRQCLVNIWLYEQTKSRIQGKIAGFDEYMNIVVRDAIQLSDLTSETPDDENDKENEPSQKALGDILLKGDNICFISSIDI